MSLSFLWEKKRRVTYYLDMCRKWPLACSCSLWISFFPRLCAS